MAGQNERHAKNGGEHQISGTHYKADGYCEETNTVFEFYGSLWHGDPAIFKADDVNPFNKKHNGDLYKLTLNREDDIKRQGYNLVTMWESSYDALLVMNKKSLT